MAEIKVFPLVPGAVYTLSHYKLDEFSSYFQRGIRQIKNTSIKGDQGMAFPVDIFLESYTSPQGQWEEFTGTVRRGDEEFSFVMRSDGADAKIKFQKKGIA